MSLFELKEGTNHHLKVQCFDEPIFFHLDNSIEISSVMKVFFYSEDGSLLQPQDNDTNLTLENIGGLLYIVIEPLMNGDFVMFLTE